MGFHPFIVQPHLFNSRQIDRHIVCADYFKVIKLLGGGGGTIREKGRF